MNLYIRSGWLRSDANEQSSLYVDKLALNITKVKCQDDSDLSQQSNFNNEVSKVSEINLELDIIH